MAVITDLADTSLSQIIPDLRNIFLRNIDFQFYLFDIHLHNLSPPNLLIVSYSVFFILPKTYHYRNMILQIVI